MKIVTFCNRVSSHFNKFMLISLQYPISDLKTVCVSSHYRANPKQHKVEI